MPSPLSIPPPPQRSATGLMTLSQVLMSVHAELRQRFDPSGVRGEGEGEGDGSTRATLHALTDEDWNVVLYPVSELRPYLQSSSSKESLATTVDTASRTPPRHAEVEHYNEEVLANYVKCRCAELPMRLQTEAVMLRRHEYAVRQRMHELIELSEYIAVCGDQVPELRDDRLGEAGALRSGGRAPHAAITSSSLATPHVEASLPTEVQQLLSPSESARRLQRAQERVKELEKIVHQESWQRLRCSHRMVLMGEVTRALLKQLQGTCAAQDTAKDDQESCDRPVKRHKHE